MFLKVQVGGFALQIGEESQKELRKSCENCIHDDWLCTHPKASECQLNMFYGGEYKYFQAKQESY